MQTPLLKSLKMFIPIEMRLTHVFLAQHTRAIETVFLQFNVKTDTIVLYSSQAFLCLFH